MTKIQISDLDFERLLSELSDPSLDISPIIESDVAEAIDDTDPSLPNDQDEWPEPDAVDDTVKTIDSQTFATTSNISTTTILMNELRPDDPSDVELYPPTLPIEVALQTAPMDDIRIAYGFSHSQWSVLIHTQRFKDDVEAARKTLAEEGMSFRAKARLQSEELLKTSWRLIHDTSGEVPPNVKADLIKFTIRAAGLEAKAADSVQAFTPLQININI